MPTIDDRLRDAGAAWRSHVDGPAAPPVPAPTASTRPGGTGPHELRRRRAVRRHRLVALAALGAAAVTFVAFAMLAAPSFQGLGGSGADCAAPTLAAAPSEGVVVRPGQVVTVNGLYFVTDCYDSGQRGDPPPYRTVTLTLEAGSHETRLATVHPDHDGAFTTTVRIPEDFPTGPATLRTGTPAARELELVVTRATPSPRPQSSSSTNR